MKPLKILSAIVGGMLFFGSAYAQEYDDLYFSTKDRAKIKKEIPKVVKPVQAAPSFNSEKASTTKTETSVGTVTASAKETPVSKFANPDFKEQPEVAETNNFTPTYNYYNENEGLVEQINPRLSSNNSRPWAQSAWNDPYYNNNFNSFNTWNTPNNRFGFNNGFGPVGYYGASAATFGPTWGNQWLYDPFYGPMYDPWGWNSFAYGPSVSLNFNFGRTWRPFRNYWGWGGRSAFGWNNWGWGAGFGNGFYCPPAYGFRNNVVIVNNNRIVGGERLVRNRYTGPVSRRGGTVGNVNNTNRLRTTDRTVTSSRRTASNQRYRESLNRRRTNTTSSRSSSGSVNNSYSSGRNKTNSSSNSIINSYAGRRRSTSSGYNSSSSSGNRNSGYRNSSSNSYRRSSGSKSNSYSSPSRRSSSSSPSYRSSSPSRSSSGSRSSSSSGARRRR